MTRFWDGRTDRQTDGQTDGVTALLDLLSPSATQVKNKEVQSRPDGATLMFQINAVKFSENFSVKYLEKRRMC